MDGDQQFMQILADMSKMKTRCKHILDVTDRYCVLTEVNTGQVHHIFLRFLNHQFCFHEILFAFFLQVKDQLMSSLSSFIQEAHSYN